MTAWHFGLIIFISRNLSKIPGFNMLNISLLFNCDPLVIELCDSGSPRIYLWEWGTGDSLPHVREGHFFLWPVRRAHFFTPSVGGMGFFSQHVFLKSV